MKNKKIMAGILSAALVAGCVSVSVYAIKDNNAKSETTAASEETKVEETGNQSTGDKLAKEETVYVIADAEGQVDKIIVSDWIKNGTQSGEIKDKTELKDIKNVKGDETYTMNGDDMCVWDAKGHDIYLQGTTDKKLPVDIKVSYKLDGKSVTPEDLKGKNGKVTIRFDYTNNEYQMKDINGTQEKIYVPFAMLTGLVLDNENFTNVEVTNGKLVNEGENTIVTGIAFPGLKENLGLGDKVEIPSYVEITADAKNFAMKNTVTVATSSIFENLDTTKINESTIKDGIGKLSDGMGQLLDGSSRLYDGVNELLEKSGDLVTGIKALAAGAEELKKGAEQVNSGAGQVQQGTEKLAAGAEKLQKEGTEQLSNGLAQISSNNSKMVGGAKQIFESLLASTQQQVSAALGASCPALTIETYATVLEGVAAQVQAAGKDPTAIKTAKAKLDSVNEFYVGIQQYTAGVKQSADGAATLNGQAAELSKGAAQVNSGAKTLTTGTAQLAAGAEKLYKGIMQLDENAPLLVGGIKQLKDGSMQLSDGLKLFNEEGIAKITELVDGDLGGIVARLRATVDVARSYKTFTGCGEGMEASTKFIYKTAEVKSN